MVYMLVCKPSYGGSTREAGGKFGWGCCVNGCIVNWGRALSNLGVE